MKGTEEVHQAQILPTLVTFEASSQEQEDEEMFSEDNLNASTDEVDGVTDRREKTSAVLLSEEELAELLKKDADEEEEEEEEGEQEKEMEVDRKMEFDEAVEVTEDEEAEGEERKLDDNLEMDEDKEGIVEDAERPEKEDGEEEMPGKEKEEKELVREMGMEEIDGSTESEIPVDLDYAADSGILQPLKILSAEVKPHMDDSHLLSKTDVSEVKEKETREEGLPSTAGDDIQNTKAPEEVSPASSKDANTQKPKIGTELERSRPAGEEDAEEEEEEERDEIKSASHIKGKMRKQKKNQRTKKHSPQRDEAQAGQEQSQQEPQDSEGPSVDNALHKAKRRRAGKWVLHTSSQLYTETSTIHVSLSSISFLYLIKFLYLM